MTRICFMRVGATPLLLARGHGEFGGAEVRALTFAREFARRGNAVDFAVAPHPDLLETTPDGIRVVPVACRSRGIRKLVKSLRGRWSSAPRPFPDIDQIEAPTIACFGVHHPTPEVIAAARAVGKKTVLFLTSSEDALPHTTGTAKSHRARKQHNDAIRFADEIVVQTETQREHLQQHFERSSWLIRNPIDTRVAEDDVPTVRSHVLWVGRADTDSKRADLCMELAVRCPRIPFRVVINGGNPALLQELLASKPKNVQLELSVPLDEIDRLYQAAAVLINTSESEGFPNAFLQAMKYQAPILSLNVDPDGVLVRHNCGQIAGSMPRMVELLSNYWPFGSTATEQGKRGRAYVIEHHELAHCVDQLSQLLTHMMASKTSAA